MLALINTDLDLPYQLVKGKPLRCMRAEYEKMEAENRMGREGLEERCMSLASANQKLTDVALKLKNQLDDARLSWQVHKKEWRDMKSS